jgi:RNA polymerase sigma-70 factor (ECF subfamily)
MTGLGAADSSTDEVPIVKGLEPFENFYRRERPGMVALAFALSRSRVGAEDLAQEALMTAYRRWDAVGRLDQPAAWVRKVVANNAWSFLRRRRAEVRAVTRAAMSGRLNLVPSLPDSSIETWDEVARLSKRQAQVVALYYVARMTMPEIAELLECSKETVNTHLRRARDTLAARLGTEERS